MDTESVLDLKEVTKEVTLDARGNNRNLYLGSVNFTKALTVLANNIGLNGKLIDYD